MRFWRYPTGSPVRLLRHCLAPERGWRSPLHSCDGIYSSVIGNASSSFTSSLHFRSQITTSAPSRATASAIACPTECFPPVTTTFFPVRSGVISQASTSGINPSSRWKKLLIRSYSLPVLRTLIMNRVTLLGIRRIRRSHPYGWSFSRAIRATSASRASCVMGPPERNWSNSFNAMAAALRIFRTRSLYLASNLSRFRDYWSVVC